MDSNNNIKYIQPQNLNSLNSLMFSFIYSNSEHLQYERNCGYYDEHVIKKVTSWKEAQEHILTICGRCWNRCFHYMGKAQSKEMINSLWWDKFCHAFQHEQEAHGEKRRVAGIPQAKDAEWLQGLVLWRKGESNIMSPFPGKPFDADLNEIGRWTMNGKEEENGKKMEWKKEEK